MKPNPPSVNSKARRLHRRKFLATGMVGMVATAVDGQAPVAAPKISDSNGAPGLVTPPSSSPNLVETSYWDRTDRFEEKMRLLEAAWQRRDYRVARALAYSLRTTLVQAEAEEASPGPADLSSELALPISSLPRPWRDWAEGWNWVQVLEVRETIGQTRTWEPVEVSMQVDARSVQSIRREIRVARLENGNLKEVVSQVFGEVRRGHLWHCRLLFMADCPAGARQTYLIFFGNSDAELPRYDTDLSTTGEGYALEVENAHYKAALSRQMGQLERITIKREHGLELFSGGQGHGEPPGIDWAHDYVASGNFQKLRISLWETCPDYEVIRGPLSTRVRRSGFPHSPVHPAFSPSRLHVDIEYQFFAGLPWFYKIGAMQAVRTFDAEALRDDEWVFSGHSFTDTVWMGADGQLRVGAVDADQASRLHAVGFFHRDSLDSFIALFLEHRAEGIPALKRAGAPTLSYKWHGQLWSRAPLPVKRVPTGATLHEKNAYWLGAFRPQEDARHVEALRQRLLHPLKMVPGAIDGSKASKNGGRLARPGEAGDSPIPKKVLWDALRDCKDAQLYTADINVVDLGLIWDIRVRGDAVHVVMAMPHRGRPLMGYFTHGSISVHPTVSVPVRERLLQVPGVRSVSFEQSWQPTWSTNLLTDEGRRRLGMDS